MQPVTTSDLMVAAQAVMHLRGAERDAQITALLQGACRAATHRRRTNRCDPQCGDGTLMGAVLAWRGTAPIAARAGDPRYLSALAAVIHGVLRMQHGGNA